MMGHKNYRYNPCTLTIEKIEICHLFTGQVMEDSGLLKVDEFLRVEGQENIFAIGDCCNIREMKLAYTAGEHGKLVAANIKAILTGNKEKPWKPGTVYELHFKLKHQKPLILIPNPSSASKFQPKNHSTGRIKYCLSDIGFCQI